MKTLRKEKSIRDDSPVLVEKSISSHSKGVVDNTETIVEDAKEEDAISRNSQDAQ